MKCRFENFVNNVVGGAVVGDPVAGTEAVGYPKNQRDYIIDWLLWLYLDMIIIIIIIVIIIIVIIIIIITIYDICLLFMIEYIYIYD